MYRFSWGACRRGHGMRGDDRDGGMGEKYTDLFFVEPTAKEKQMHLKGQLERGVVAGNEFEKSEHGLRSLRLRLGPHDNLVIVIIIIIVVVVVVVARRILGLAMLGIDDDLAFSGGRSGGRVARTLRTPVRWPLAFKPRAQLGLGGGSAHGVGAESKADGVGIDARHFWELVERRGERGQGYDWVLRLLSREGLLRRVA